MGVVKVPGGGGEARPILSVKSGFEFDVKDKYSEPTVFGNTSCSTALPAGFDISGKKFRMFVGELGPGQAPWQLEGGRGYVIRNLLSTSVENTEISGEVMKTFDAGYGPWFVKFRGDFAVTIRNDNGVRCVEWTASCKEWATNNSIRYMRMMSRLEIYE